MDEFAIREINGVRASYSDHRIVLCEKDASIVVEVTTTSGVVINLSAARRLARQLHRLATRIERRTPPAETAEEDAQK